MCISSMGRKAGSWRVSTLASGLVAGDSSGGAGPAGRPIESSTGPSCRRRPRPLATINKAGLSLDDKATSKDDLAATFFGRTCAPTFVPTSSMKSSPQPEPTIPLRGECEKPDAFPDHALPDDVVSAVHPGHHDPGWRLQQLARKAVRSPGRCAPPPGRLAADARIIRLLLKKVMPPGVTFFASLGVVGGRRGLVGGRGNCSTLKTAHAHLSLDCSN
jgi:hypothetical protein